MSNRPQAASPQIRKANGQSSAIPKFADLEIYIQPRDDEGYPVVLTTGRGRQSSRSYLHLEPSEWASTGTLSGDGGALFDALFKDPTAGLGRQWAEVLGKHPHRRVRLRISRSAPELHAIPWELLREPRREGAPIDLAADPHTPFSRYLAGDWEPGASVETKPIRILVAVAAPDDLSNYGLAEIFPEDEYQRLRAVLGDSDEVELVRLDGPCTLNSISRALEDDIHVLHFVGHGLYEIANAGDGGAGQVSLVLENAAGTAILVEEADFAAMVQNHQRRSDLARRLRLITLMSCATAKRDSGDVFRGLAPKLLAAEVPAVVAMQDSVTVESAEIFTSEFYRRLADHGLVDLATNQARYALIGEKRPDYAVPVLFMRLEDGRLFGAEPKQKLSRSLLAVGAIVAALLVFLLAANLAGMLGPTMRSWLAPPLCAENPLCVIVTTLAPPESELAQRLTRQLADEIDRTLELRGTDNALVLNHEPLAQGVVESGDAAVDARRDQARQLGLDEGALLVIWGDVHDSPDSQADTVRVYFNLVPLLGIADAPDLRTFRAEPVQYDRVTESVECRNCIDLAASELEQHVDIIAYTAAGLLHYADQTELAFEDFVSALYCAGEPVDADLIQVLRPDCTPSPDPLEWTPGLLYYYAGKSATIGGDHRVGIALLETAAELNPIDSAAPIGIAAAYQDWLADAAAPQAQAALDEAEHRINHLLPLNRDPAKKAELYHNLGVVNELRRDWRAAAKNYHAAATFYADAAPLNSADQQSSYVSLVQAGHAERMDEDFSRARATLERATELGVHAPWAYLDLAQLAWQAAGDRVAAERWLDKTAAEFPDIAYVYLHRAELCEQWQDLDCAATAFADALQRRPASGWLYSRAGDFYRRNAEALGSLTPAAEHYEMATVLRPNDPWAHERYAYVRYSQNEVEDAIISLERAISLTLEDSAPGRLYCNLAKAMSANGLDATDASDRCAALSDSGDQAEEATGN